jgi:uncharacterized protein (TIGR02594 family)
VSDFWSKITEALKEIVKTEGQAKAPLVPMGATSYKNVPAKWQWITKITGLPQIVQEALKEVGTLEAGGTLNNRKIIGWADEIARCNPTTYNNWAADWYTQDSVPWCGLFVALVACRSANGKTNRMPVKSYLSSLAWANWGNGVSWKTNLNNIYCGDVAVFTRTGGGHVSVIIGVSKDGKYLLCCGGNQDNAVNIKLFPISRLYAVRRPPYSIKPAGAKHIRVATTGVPISNNEA